MAGILSKCRGEMSESHLLLEVHLGGMEESKILNALLLEGSRPVSLTVHLPNKAIGDHLQRVHTEDEMERVANELDEALPSDPHVAYPRQTSSP